MKNTIEGLFEYAKNNKALTATYIVMRGFVLAVLLMQSLQIKDLQRDKSLAYENDANFRIDHINGLNDLYRQAYDWSANLAKQIEEMRNMLDSSEQLRKHQLEAYYALKQRIEVLEKIHKIKQPHEY